MSGSPLINGASTEVLGAITTAEVAEYHLEAEDRMQHNHKLSCSTNR